MITLPRTTRHKVTKSTSDSVAWWQTLPDPPPCQDRHRPPPGKPARQEAPHHRQHPHPRWRHWRTPPRPPRAPPPTPIPRWRTHLRPPPWLDRRRPPPEALPRLLHLVRIVVSEEPAMQGAPHYRQHPLPPTSGSHSSDLRFPAALFPALTNSAAGISSRSRRVCAYPRRVDEVG